MVECSVRKISKTQSLRSPKNTFPEVFHAKLFAFNIKWTKCRWYQLINVDCSIVNSEAIQLFDFIKLNIFRKLAYKVKLMEVWSEI